MKILVEFRGAGAYWFSMRRHWIWPLFIFCLTLALPASAATGRVMKVLPLFLDAERRESLSPSLYERDAYQMQLRLHPERRSGIRFAVQFKARRPVWEPLRLRIELRGTAAGQLPRQMVLEQPIETTGWFGRWTTLTLTGDEYRNFGEVTSWRVSLWEGEQLVGEQKSFLW